MTAPNSTNSEKYKHLRIVYGARNWTKLHLQNIHNSSVKYNTTFQIYKDLL